MPPPFSNLVVLLPTMAYAVRRPGERFELRESAWTPKGPRSRTLATFADLTPEVVERAMTRSHGVTTKGELLAAARRAGAPVPRPPADDAAVRLIDAIENGDALSPAVERVLRDRIGVRSHQGATGRSATDSERSAAAWLGRSLADRGEALRQLLLLADRLPSPRRSEQPAFPPIRTTGP